MAKDYFMGLDMGTGSLGWAITDKNYHLLKAHGKALWGVRLFESASTAEERRMFRTGRRRLERRKWRIELLQELFAEEINKVDSGFFLRMKESRYVPEDKRDIYGQTPDLPYALFVDSTYTDKEYHKQFPTIYHLRKWLMETTETPDIRLVYLALHHMMKHRGHFLLSGNIENVREFKSTFTQFIQRVKDEEMNFNLDFDIEKIDQIENIITDSNRTKSQKKTELIKCAGAKTSCEKALMNLIVGGTVKLSDIFDNKELDNCEKAKISFSDTSYEDYSGIVQSDLGEQYIIIEQAKSVYDWAILADILKGEDSISSAKVGVYEKHKKDLTYLKKLVKENLSGEDYKKIFVNTTGKLDNYCAYVGTSKMNGHKCDLEGKCCDRKAFYAFLKKEVIKPIGETEAIEYLKKELETETFLPKQISKDNGVIPYQVHLYELNKIIENLEDKVPLLKEQGNKIRSIFEFRIPYYVGPLNGIWRDGKRTNWMVRRNNEKIYPWNFDEVVNQSESAEAFIRRMTNKCTYLVHEDVLPKNSLLYSKFIVLNELNNLRINGEAISVELKQKLYRDLFQRYRKVTQKRVRDYLVREGLISKAERNTADISGVDGDFKGSLTAYHDFKEKLTGCTLKDEDMEEMILNITLFGEDKKLLGKRLSVLYPELTEGQRKALCSLSYDGWGKLSEAFLQKITAPAPETGEVWTVIRALWETNDNLMQILSKKYLFADAIERENCKEDGNEITREMLEKLQVSPAVKRQIWQTLQVIKELHKVMNEPPKRIFIEMAREKAEKKRTDSRKKALLDLYKKCKSEERDWIKELNAFEDHNLRSDKLYLYYTQKGRCMYSGEVIELEDLWDNRKYDIDHIYPQSKVMDDSLDNRVLVKKTYNAGKTDVYPIEHSIREKMHSFWKSLFDGGFISKEKYKRLIRGDEFAPEELAGFIERQIVETRQSTKAVASVLKQIFPETEIVYVKAGNVSRFRQDFDLIKVRELNDLHHAKDAYLNIVVGNAYYTKFTMNVMRYVKDNPGRAYNLKRMFTSKWDIERNGEIAWKAGEAGTIATVKETMRKNNILVTRRSYKVKGGLFDQQLMKKGKGQVPVKGSDERLRNIEKYGGYNKAQGTYFMLVESIDKKGNKIRTIEYVPLYLKVQLEKDEELMKQYLISDRELKEPRILYSIIKIDTLFKVDGFYMWLSGRTGKQLIFKGAVQLILSKEDEMILKKILKFVSRRTENPDIKIIEKDGLEEADLIHMYEVFLDKIENTVYRTKLDAQVQNLKKGKKMFESLSKEDKCIVLSEILHLFQCQSNMSDLKLIGGPEKAGSIKINKNITECKQISIINQSPTGIFQQEIDLKKI